MLENDKVNGGAHPASTVQAQEASIFAPQNTQQVQEVVAWALAQQQPLQIEGTGTKLGWGRAVELPHRLTLKNFSGIIDYQPEELVLTAKAGTPMAQIEAALAEHGQILPFEPINPAAFASGHGEPMQTTGTLGGVLATNLSGPRRLKAGAARDHVLGLTAVSGRAEVFKAGGKVVKNVTGYDVARAFCNSWGTLMIATELTLKVLPRPQEERSLCVLGASCETASQIMSAAMASSAEVSSAAYLPDFVARRLASNPLADMGSLTLLRLEGSSGSIAARFRQLQSALNAYGEQSTLDASTSGSIWRQIRDVVPLALPQTCLWRISLAPAHGHRFLQALPHSLASGYFRDWAGGLVWLQTPTEEPEGETIRAALHKAGGGHATLMRAPLAQRQQQQVFQPQPAPLQQLSQRIKQQFDPQAVLNPGRMYAGS